MFSICMQVCERVSYIEEGSSATGGEGGRGVRHLGKESRVQKNVKKN
jgi:hypothetical protein